MRLPRHRVGVVYRIRDTFFGGSYIGGTAHFASRLSAHRCTLLAGKHYNSGLQSAFDRGQANLLVEILELVPLLKKGHPHFSIDPVEKRWINSDRPEFNTIETNDDLSSWVLPEWLKKQRAASRRATMAKRAEEGAAIWI